MAVRQRLLIGVVLLFLGVVVPAAVGASPPAAIVTGQDGGWPAVNAWTAAGVQAAGIAPKSGSTDAH